MVIGGFPVLKLGVIFIRQISRPISHYFVAKTKTNRYFKEYFCIAPARLYNWCESKLNMSLLNMKTPVKIQVLNEKDAVELGASLMEEGLVFFMASTILLAEYNRQKWNEGRKETARRKDMDDIVASVERLTKHIEQNGVYIQEISDKVMHNTLKDDEQKIPEDTDEELPPQSCPTIMDSQPDDSSLPSATLTPTLLEDSHSPSPSTPTIMVDTPDDSHSPPSLSPPAIIDSAPDDSTHLDFQPDDPLAPSTPAVFDAVTDDSSQTNTK